MTSAGLGFDARFLTAVHSGSSVTLAAKACRTSGKTTRRRERAAMFSSQEHVFNATYLRAAQAYMLISIPTWTSKTFGAVQAIVLFSRFTRRVLSDETIRRSTKHRKNVRR
jgi:hypothetical protein